MHQFVGLLWVLALNKLEKCNYNKRHFRQGGLERAGQQNNEKNEQHWSGVKLSFKGNRQKIDVGKKTLAKQGTRRLEPALRKTNVTLHYIVVPRSYGPDTFGRGKENWKHQTKVS